MAPNFILLRKAQLDRLADLALRDYQDRMAGWIRREFPADSDRLGDDGVRSWVVSARDRAAAYGMTTSVEVTGFLSLMLVLGEDFDTRFRSEWIPPILASKSLPGGEKFRIILQHELDAI
jgi:hypothetical protein